MLPAVSQPKLGAHTDITLGGGVSYRLGIHEQFSAPGFNIESYLRFVEEYKLGLDFSYYVAKGNFSPTDFEINLNGTVLLFIYEGWQILGLAGIQFAWFEYDWGEIFGDEYYNGLGFNLGASCEHEVTYEGGKIDIFVDPKITFYNVNELRVTPSISIGVRHVF